MQHSFFRPPPGLEDVCPLRPLGLPLVAALVEDEQQWAEVPPACMIDDSHEAKGSPRSAADSDACVSTAPSTTAGEEDHCVDLSCCDGAVEQQQCHGNGEPCLPEKPQPGLVLLEVSKLQAAAPRFVPRGLAVSQPISQHEGTAPLKNQQEKSTPLRAKATAFVPTCGKAAPSPFASVPNGVGVPPWNWWQDHSDTSAMYGAIMTAGR